jgi:hypothetical protein
MSVLGVLARVRDRLNGDRLRQLQQWRAAAAQSSTVCARSMAVLAAPHSVRVLPRRVDCSAARAVSTTLEARRTCAPMIMGVLCGGMPRVVALGGGVRALHTSRSAQEDWRRGLGRPGGPPPFPPLTGLPILWLALMAVAALALLAVFGSLAVVLLLNFWPLLLLAYVAWRLTRGRGGGARAFPGGLSSPGLSAPSPSPFAQPPFFAAWAQRAMEAAAGAAAAQMEEQLKLLSALTACTGRALSDSPSVARLTSGRLSLGPPMGLSSSSLGGGGRRLQVVAPVLAEGGRSVGMLRLEVGVEEMGTPPSAGVTTSWIAREWRSAKRNIASVFSAASSGRIAPLDSFNVGAEEGKSPKGRRWSFTVVSADLSLDSGQRVDLSAEWSGGSGAWVSQPGDEDGKGRGRGGGSVVGPTIDLDPSSFHRTDGEGEREGGEHDPPRETTRERRERLRGFRRE